MVEGVQLQLNQISYLLDKQQTGEQFQRSSPGVVKVLNPTLGFPA